MEENSNVVPGDLVWAVAKYEESNCAPTKDAVNGLVGRSCRIFGVNTTLKRCEESDVGKTYITYYQCVEVSAG